MANDDKKDLTDLISLEDPLQPAGGESPNDFATTDSGPTENPIEGFTGLITPEPQSLPTGTEEAVGEDPFASLPPIDADLISTATGGNTSASFGMASETATEGTGAISSNTVDDLGDMGPIFSDAPIVNSAPLEATAPDFSQKTSTSPTPENLGEGLLEDPSEFSSPVPDLSTEPSPDLETLEEEAAPTPPPAVKAIQAGMEEIKKYSEHVSPTEKLQVPAGIPYSLLIVGRLKVHEKERLVSIATRELGLREVDLEPQLEAGRILIPRVSEYAGVMIVQALKTARVKMRLGPSDTIFSSKDSMDEDAPYSSSDPIQYTTTESGQHPADLISITPDKKMGDKTLKILDTIHASMNVKASHVHSTTSSVFQESLDALKRQLKFRAYHQGANAIVSFTTQMIPIQDQTQYKLIAQGTAVVAN